MDTTEELLEKDEDLKATESRIVELRQKKDRTPEEEAEFKELRQHHKSRINEQIQSERDAANKERERAAKAEQALEDARARLKEIEEKRDAVVTQSGDENETCTINGKTFYTDQAIAIRVQKGLMTQAKGWEMQKAMIKEEAKQEMAGARPQEEARKIRQESLDYVKKEGYGWMLDEKDPKHNPKDPLYIEADRLWKNGFQYDPDGPRKALETAKRLLGRDVKREDMSDEFGVPKNGAAASSQKEKKIELSQIEQDNAIRYYVFGNVINPKTGKHFTETEALQKALEAKRKRLVKV